jgi:hypothetical protein
VGRLAALQPRRYAFIDHAAPNPRAALHQARLSDRFVDGEHIRIRPSSISAGVVVFARPEHRDATTDGPGHGVLRALRAPPRARQLLPL